MDLRSGATRLTAWLEDKARVGQFVTLKNSDEPGRMWEVVDKYASVELSSINRGWNNNI
jgi:hypothetical protein